MVVLLFLEDVQYKHSGMLQFLHWYLKISLECVLHDGETLFFSFEEDYIMFVELI